MPVEGGYLNQPAYLMLMLDVVADALAERRKIEAINLRLQREETTTTTKTEGSQGLPQSKG